MSVDQRNSYELYWTTREYIALANLKKIMPYNRFVIILRCLHVCDNTKIDGTDKLAKIRPMLNILVAAWQAAYYRNREICLDDSMIAFKGRTSAMVYQPKSLINGRCRRGSWPIQEPHTATTSKFILASGLIMSIQVSVSLMPL